MLAVFTILADRLHWDQEALWYREQEGQHGAAILPLGHRAATPPNSIWGLLSVKRQILLLVKQPQAEGQLLMAIKRLILIIALVALSAHVSATDITIGIAGQSDGGQTPASHTFTDTGTCVFKAWLVDSTHVSFSVNGTTLFSNIAITGSFGSNVKASIEQVNQSIAYYTWKIGEAKWQ